MKIQLGCGSQGMSVYSPLYISPVSYELWISTPNFFPFYLLLVGNVQTGHK